MAFFVTSGDTDVARVAGAKQIAEWLDNILERSQTEGMQCVSGFWVDGAVESLEVLQ